MRTKSSVYVSSCPAIQGEQPGNLQWHDQNRKSPSRFGWIVLIVMTLMLVIPTTAMSAKGGNGSGGGGGGAGGGGGGGGTTVDNVDNGELFGDLMHILRYEYYDDSLGEYVSTGQPIFAQRWVEMPAELPGYGWGYCAIGIDEFGDEIPFAPYSCDLAPLDPEDVIEVDYFGRLNAARVQERNMRMHLDESISNIKKAGQIRLDPTGRLELGFESEDNTGEPLCVLGASAGLCEWSTIDSPMENLALYRRMMKYGHLSTNPKEADLWWHGDPKTDPLEIVHPALEAADFDKFIAAGLDTMLPDRTSCWNGDNYISVCDNAEHLTFEDFNTSAVFLGASAGKHGIITDHLVQYLNRFLKITLTTDFADSTLDTLPALYRDCYEGQDPWQEGEEAPADVDLTVELAYGDCEILDADAGTPNYADFSNIQELFVDFGESAYVRNSVWSGSRASLALESTPGTSSGTWGYNPSVPLLSWIKIPNPASPFAIDIHNFVGAASDALRAIEYVHNYEVPENLYCTYDLSYCE